VTVRKRPQCQSNHRLTETSGTAGDTLAMSRFQDYHGSSYRQRQSEKVKERRYREAGSIAEPRWSLKTMNSHKQTVITNEGALLGVAGQTTGSHPESV
jgi:hypothetical protein